MEQLTVDIFRLTEILETQVKELTQDAEAYTQGLDLRSSFARVKELLEEANHTLSQIG